MPPNPPSKFQNLKKKILAPPPPCQILGTPLLGTDVIMQNTSIQCVKSTKFLGVIIDNKLRSNDHITYVKNKFSKSLGILYKIRRYLDNTTLTNMYYSFVFPYLIYCVEIWESSLKSYLNPLVKIQKKCIRPT